jgi:capsular polysaccharide biosynthesis protein
MNRPSALFARATFNTTTIRDALDALRSPRARWRVPAAGAILAAVLASWWQSVWPPAYTATARIVLDPNAAGTSGAAAEWIATQAELIRSDPVARRVAADLDLAKSLSGGSAPDRDASAERLLARLAVEPSPRGGLIAVSYASSDPALAAQVADAFVVAYDEVSRDIQAAAATAIRERARAQLSTLRDEVEQAQRHLEAVDRTPSQDEVPSLAKAMQLARLASPVNWSGLPGEQKAEPFVGSLLADPEHSALDGATLERSAPGGALQDLRADLEQASQTFLAAQARLVQFDSDRMLARPAMSVLSRARESVTAPDLSTRQIVLLAALCGLFVAWLLRAAARRIDRRVVDARDLARIAGIAVLGVLTNAEARSPRARRVPARPIAAHGDVAPALQ